MLIGCVWHSGNKQFECGKCLSPLVGAGALSFRVFHKSNQSSDQRKVTVCEVTLQATCFNSAVVCPYWKEYSQAVSRH